MKKTEVFGNRCLSIPEQMLKYSEIDAQVFRNRCSCIWEQMLMYLEIQYFMLDTTVVIFNFITFAPLVINEIYCV